MASDWIKMRSDLYRDPKVSVMADTLMGPEGDLARYVDHNCQRHMSVTRNIMRNATVGGLVSVWGVMRQRGKRQGDDLVCDGITCAVIDDIADLPGFGAAMVACGWLIETEEGVEFPHFFEEYNVSIEGKTKTAGALRQQRYRDKIKAQSDVTTTEASNVTRDVTVTPREEKNREESSSLRSEDKNSAQSASPSADVATVFEFWKATMSSPRSLLDKKRSTAIKAALKTGYTVEQLCDAIAGCAKSAFHMGENDRGMKYNGLDLILRNAEHIDKFIVIGQSPIQPVKARKPGYVHDLSQMDYTQGVDSDGRF